MKLPLLLIVALVGLFIGTINAQTRKSTLVKPVAKPVADSLVIPITKADLGTFPYFKTLPNFSVVDSVTMGTNRTYFYTGKTYLTVDGIVSAQKMNVRDSNKSNASEFECIQAFDKVIKALGGVKIYSGKLPEEPLKALTGNGIVDVQSKHSLAESAHYGVVEYVLRTPDKEVWVQLEPYSLGSKFYTLLVVERTNPLLMLNTNNANVIQAALEKTGKAITHLTFEPDQLALTSESKDELMNLLGIIQAHPDWKLRLELYNAPVGPAAYSLALTNKRVQAIKQSLVDMGVKSAAVDAVGMGEQKPLVPNDTEQGRLTNSRLEITKL